MTFAISLLMLIISPLHASAQTCAGVLPAGIECVSAGGTKAITAFSTCASITNSHATGLALMVPVGSTNDWSTFLAKLPAGVTSGSCVADGCVSSTLGGSCADGSIYAGDISGVRYATTPGGCTNATSPTCNGTSDAVALTWGASGIATAATSLTDGESNTNLLATTYADTYAAKYCYDLSYAGRTDWFLPSRGEVQLLYAGRASLSGIRTGDSYISSSESPMSGPTFVWRVNFVNGSNGNVNKSSTTAYIRCMRKL